MSTLNLSQLDDALVSETCPGFTGGQHSSGPPDQLAATEASSLINMDIRDGSATTRRGTERLGTPRAGALQGLCWYDTPALEYLVAAANGSLWKWNETAWTSCSIYTAANATLPVSFAQLSDKLYIADGASHLYSWDGATLTDLGTGGASQPPVAPLLISAQNRLWMAGVAAVPDALYASRLEDGATWSSTDLMIRIGGGEGDPITGLAEWDDYQIVVFKRNSIYLVRADPATTNGSDAAHSLSKATITRLSDSIGCIAPRSIARVENEIWFLSDGGVFRLARASGQTQREVKPAVSQPVQDVIDRIRASVASQAAAICWNHRYLLSLPLDGDSSPTTVLVYDTMRQAWSGTWTGWAPRCWAVSKAAGLERLSFGRSDGAVHRWLDYVLAENEVESTYQDAGSNIPSAVVTRAMSFGEAISTKSAFHVQAEFFGSRAAAKVAVRLDEDEPVLLKGDVATDLATLEVTFALPATLPSRGLKRRAFGGQHLPPFRTMQGVVSAAAGKLAVRSVLATAFVNTVRVDE